MNPVRGRRTVYEALGRHPVHPFPARMAPDVALKVLSDGKPGLRVLDPMMGSGTVLAFARANGHRSIGVDVDPLSILIATVWTSTVDPISVRLKARKVLLEAKRDFASMPVSKAYPRNADDETKKFVRYWFDGYVRRQLASLANAIHRVRHKPTQDILWCALSRLIITKQTGVSLAMDLAHSRPHKSYKTAPIKPFNNFLIAIDNVIQNCVNSEEKSRGPTPTIKSGDARKLSLRSSSIDLVLTSPPYLNAIDYMRCSKFSLVWMGIDVKRLRAIRAKSVGAEVGNYAKLDLPEKIIKELKLTKSLSSRHKAILSRYIDDMRAAVLEVFRVLVPGGKAIYVLGENAIRGTYIRNSKIIAAIGKECGLKFVSQQTRSLPPNRRYLPPPSSKPRTGSFDVRMRREVILSFEKPLRRIK